MTLRFLALILSSADQRGAIIGRLRGHPGLRQAFAEDAVIVFTNEACRLIPLPDDRSCVIGDLFHRHGGQRPLEQLDEAAGAVVVDSSGDQLIKSYWGSYVAILRDGASLKFMRDPSGALPAYAASIEGGTVIASDVAALYETGLISPSIDWQGLEWFLYSGGLPSARTALEGVSELLPGTALEFDAGPGRSVSCWSPWDYVSRDRDPDQRAASERLKRVVTNCVRATTAGYSRPIISVSGGLDSSIVAACLKTPPGVPLCMTMFTDDPAGDERIFAQQLCDSLGFDLVAKRYEVDDIDIREASGSHLPRPIGRTQSIAYERALVDLAEKTGADCFVTGNGGDNVFAYSRSATAIVDRFRSEGLTVGLFQTLNDVSRLTGGGPIQVIRAALRVARAPSAAYRWRPNTRFLHPEMIAAQSTRPLSHPWLQAPEGALPGQAAHIAGLLGVQQHLAPKRSRHARVINPLLAQPIVEECLGIPSWQWCMGGENRAVARAAFAADLPQSIVRRSVKGTPDSFSAQIIEHFRPDITERLLEGRLAGLNLLDREALEKRLRDERPTLGEERVRILDLLDTEAWLDHWDRSSLGG